MKKISILVAAALIAVGFSLKAQASEVTISFKGGAGVTPDSIVYPIDKAIDNLRITISMNDKRKAEVLTSIAKERLGESELMTEKGKAELAEGALKEYNDKMLEAADKLEKLINETNSNEGITEEVSEESAEQVSEGIPEEPEASELDGLENIVQETQDKSLEVLNNLANNKGESTSKVLTEIIEIQKIKKEAVDNFVKERHEFNAAKKALNMAKVKLKKAQKGEDEEEVKKAQETLAEKQEAYNAAKAELLTAFEQKKMVSKDKLETEKVKVEETSTTVPGEAIQEDKKAEKTENQSKINNGNNKNNSKAELKNNNKDEKEVNKGKSTEIKKNNSEKNKFKNENKNNGNKR